MKVKWAFNFSLFSLFTFLLLACTNPIMELARPRKGETPELPPIYAITYMDVGNQTFSGEHKSGYPATHTYGTATTLVDPTKKGYIFGGWFINSHALGTPLTSLSATAYTEGITLYARWNIVSQTGHHLMQIPAGTFMMGSPTSEPGRVMDNETQHKVTLTKGYYMGKYQVTQTQYQAVIGTNPSSFTTPVSPETSTAKRPVEMVNWYDALVFCNKLSMAEGLSPAYRISGSTDPAAWGTVPTGSNATWNAVQIVANSNGYRLPTDAQWEYACRAGTTTAFNWGTNTINQTQANYEVDLNRTTEVGSYAPNAWGLYDMHGNVWEWCWDWYEPSYYSSSPVEDPTGPVSDVSSRITRGGSMGIIGENLRSAMRSRYNPSTRTNRTIGFRVVRP